MFVTAGSANLRRHKLSFRKSSHQKLEDKSETRIGLRMTARRRNTKNGHVVGAQLDLYRSVEDRAAGLEPAADSAEPRKSAEEIEMQNRSAAAQFLFVFKKHDATRLHYDLRLGWNGVMVSWAIPEGPSYCPEHKRKAIQVKDHARENAGFEGVLPEGSPGAGTVMLWDTGIWTLQPGCVDVDAGLRDGYLKLTMCGEKIKGNWTLVRTEGKEGNGQEPLWLLIKDDDEFARASDEPSILEEAPNSVATGRSLEEIAQDWVRGKRRNTSQAELF